MTVFYLIRHGEPQWDVCREYGLIGHGRDLTPLTEKGIEQAKKSASDPRLIGADLIISSPYTRALQTAAIISKELNIDISVEFDLREWQPDLTFQYDSEAKMADLRDDYELHKGIPPTDGEVLWESKDSLETRVMKVLKKYQKYDNVIVVAHGMAFRALNNGEDLAHCGLGTFQLTP